MRRGQTARTPTYIGPGLAALATDSSDAIRCSRVEISGTRISQLDGEKVMVPIQRDRMKHIKLCYDADSKYPFCQYFLGFILLFYGLVGLLITFLASLAGGSPVQAESGDFVLPVIPITGWLMVGIGFSLLFRIFRGRYLFLVNTGNETHKIFFEKSIDISEIKQFIRKAQVNFGYSIDDSILQNESLSS